MSPQAAIDGLKWLMFIEAMRIETAIAGANITPGERRILESVAGKLKRGLDVYESDLLPVDAAIAATGGE